MPDDQPGDPEHPDREIHRDPDAAYSARPDAPTEERFSEGQEREPENPQDAAIGDFAEGQTRDAGAHKRAEERFSEGQEDLPETPEKEEIGTFAEGQEELDDDADGPRSRDRGER